MRFFTYLLLLFCLLPFTVCGKQINNSRTDTLPQQISWQQQDTAYIFDSHLRPLRQVAGAPEAFYTYFWEFGDGGFSFDKQPEHTYQDSGTYMVRLYATNNYDDGKAPPTRPRKIVISSGDRLASNSNHSGFFDAGRNLQLKVNRMPKPGEDMICIIGYQNTGEKDMAMNGSLVLFYNDTKFKKKNFGLSDLRKYHEETSSDMEALLAACARNNMVPVYAVNDRYSHGPAPVTRTMTMTSSPATGMLLQKQQFFDNQNILRFSNLKTGEKRYVFAVLHTTPEMIKDTNATVTLSAMMIPDNPAASVVVYNLELQIVASHDPNRMMLSNRRLNYRLMGQHKNLRYKVRFQNTGKGPAHTIRIGIKTSDFQNPATLEINDMYPKCIPCSAAQPGQSCLDTTMRKDSIYFTFKNIYLPGIRQKGVEDKDSTKGFVEYHIRFKEKPPKLPFWNQAGIVFDKNEPVYTNKMHTRFIHGISPAVIAGYLKGFNDSQNKNSPFIIGAALAPYSPYRAYFQVEAYVGIYKKFHSRQTTQLSAPRDTSWNGQGYILTGRIKSVTRGLLSLDIVPLEVRKNLNDWISIGGGAWLRGNLYEKTTTKNGAVLTDPRSRKTTDVYSKPVVQKESFSHINPALFADVNLGKVRVGPAVGVRLLHFFNPDKTGLMMYAIWRF